MSRRPQVSRLHIARVEQAVNRYSPLIWQRTTPVFQRWLRRLLRELRPTLEAMRNLEQRVRLDPDVLALVEIIEAYRAEAPEPSFEPIIADITEGIALQFGFLPDDPRREALERYTIEILEDDLSQFWQSLTEPELLARRLTKFRNEGLSYVETSRAVARQYQTEFYRAERLVRSSYNSSANFANYQDLQEAGVERHSWLTARDARVRTPQAGNPFDHLAADGQTVPVGQPFIISGEELLFPGDRSRGASPGNVINCRCTTVSEET